MQSRLWASATAILLFFLVLACFQGYWQIIAAPWLTSLPYDQTAVAEARLVKPGSVLTRDGVKILGPTRSHANNAWSYEYRNPDEYSHFLGYNEHTGLRGSLSKALLGQGTYGDWQTRLASPVPHGCDVVLTIDSAAQKAACDALRGYNGCAIAIRASDGAVLALASSPSFNPADLASREKATVMTNDPSQPLLDRPVEGLYNPGWGMAWVTAAAALDSHDSRVTSGLDCTGRYECDHHTFECTAVHGRISVPGAVLEGCVSGIAQLAERLGEARFRKFVKSAHLLDPADLDIPSKAGRMPSFTNWRGKVNLAEASLGERETRLTPLAIARFFLSIARGGQVIQPFMVAQVKSPSGEVVRKSKAGYLGRCMSAKEAKALEAMMVTSDSPWSAIATGRNEPSAFAAWWSPSKVMNLRGDAWFVAMTPRTSPSVVVLLVLEDQADENMAVDLGLSLLHYLQNMSV